MGLCVPGMSCYQNTTSECDGCTNPYYVYPTECTSECTPISSDCVTYTGASLSNSGIESGDDLTEVIQRLDELISSGGVPLSRELTINGVTYDLSEDREWTVGEVVTLTEGTGIDITGSYPNFTISATGVGSGDMILASTQTSTGKKTFQPDVTNAGINVGSLAGNPLSLTNGDIWYNSSSNSFTVRTGGSTRQLTFAATTITLDSVPYSSSILNGALAFSAAFTYNGSTGVLLAPRFIGGPTATLAGLNTGVFAGDPSTLSNGDLWYNSAGNVLNARINGATVPLGAGGSGITVGTTTITSGTNTKVLYNNSGVVGEYTVSGSGNVAMTTSPTITSPIIDGYVTLPSSSKYFYISRVGIGEQNPYLILGSPTDDNLQTHRITTDGLNVIATREVGGAQIEIASSGFVLTNAKYALSGGPAGVAATGTLTFLAATGLCFGIADHSIEGAIGISGSVTGKNLTVKAGNGYSVGNNNGGNLFFDGGTKNGSGTNGNIGFFTTTGSFGSGEKVTFVANSTTVASSNPTGGIIKSISSTEPEGSNELIRTPDGHIGKTILQKKVTIAGGATLRAIGSAPQTIIAAPGSGKYLNIVSVTVSYKYGSAVYNFGDTLLRLYCDAGTDGFILPATGYFNVAANFNRNVYSNTSTYGTAISTNTSFKLSTYSGGSDATTGDGDLDVVVYYTVENENA